MKKTKDKQEPGGVKKQSISNEISYGVGRSVIAVFLVVIIFSVLMIQSVVMSGRETELTLQSQSAAYEITGFFDVYLRMVEQMAVNPEIEAVMKQAKAGDDITKVEGFPTVYEDLVHIAGTDAENIMASWIADVDANMVTQSDDFTSGEGWEITERAWYVCTQTGQAMLTEPYVDASTGNTILSAVAPVYDSASGEVLGVAGLDLSLAHVAEIMQTYKIGSSGYLMLLSSQGLILYHPNEELIQQNVAEADVSDNIRRVAETKESQLMTYKVLGQSRHGFVAQIGDTGYLVISSMSGLEYYSRLILMIIGMLVIFALGMLAIILTSRRVAAGLTKPILKLNDVAQELAAGNLDVELAVETDNEIGELADAIGKTVVRLKEYIVYIDEIAEVLGQIAAGHLRVELKNDYAGEFRKVKDAMLEISSSLSEILLGISESAEQVSAGADDLANAAQGLAESTGTQAASVQELVATTDTIVEKLRENRNDAESSAKQTEVVTGMMEESREQMEQMREAMNKIHETSNQVVGIIKTIEEIADQTNLLALNASIEAARAGEAGKGFAVVADEIGKLADESSKAANKTRDLIGISMAEVAKGDEYAESVAESLRAAVEAVNRVNDMIRSTAQNAIEQTASMEQMQTGTESISEGIQDNSATAEESSATSQELAAQAAVLKEMVQRFELES